MMQETYMVEEQPQESPPVISVETSDDGTTRRTETTVIEDEIINNCLTQITILKHLRGFSFG